MPFMTVGTRASFSQIGEWILEISKCGTLTRAYIACKTNMSPAVDARKDTVDEFSIPEDLDAIRGIQIKTMLVELERL